MTRAKRRRADPRNRGIRDLRGGLWELELGRHTDSLADEMAGATGGRVTFTRKPDGLAFSVAIPPGRTLADYDDDALAAMIEDRLAGREGA